MPPHQWLEKNLGSHDRLGYDPWLHTVESAERLAKACAESGASLVAVEPDLVDAIWADRPAPRPGARRPYYAAFASVAVLSDTARIRPEEGELKRDPADD